MATTTARLLHLAADTAADLMVPDVPTLPRSATFDDALGFFIDRNVTVAADLMTPAVFSIGPDTPAADVIGDMLRSRVHHLFVTDPDGTIVGVVSTCDVLRHLK